MTSSKPTLRKYRRQGAAISALGVIFAGVGIVGVVFEDTGYVGIGVGGMVACFIGTLAFENIIKAGDSRDE